jgi:Na+/melibiose symporter-like transporter
MLPRLTDATGSAMTAALLEYQKLYPLCAARHNALVAEIEQRENGITP